MVLSWARFLIKNRQTAYLILFYDATFFSASYPSVVATRMRWATAVIAWFVHRVHGAALQVRLAPLFFFFFSFLFLFLFLFFSHTVQVPPGVRPVQLGAMRPVPVVLSVTHPQNGGADHLLPTKWIEIGYDWLLAIFACFSLLRNQCNVSVTL
jgi:hypothetical protein